MQPPAPLYLQHSTALPSPALGSAGLGRGLPQGKDQARVMLVVLSPPNQEQGSQPSPHHGLGLPSSSRALPPPSAALSPQPPTLLLTSESFLQVLLDISLCFALEVPASTVPLHLAQLLEQRNPPALPSSPLGEHERFFLQAVVITLYIHTHVILKHLQCWNTFHCLSSVPGTQSEVQAAAGAHRHTSLTKCGPSTALLPSLPGFQQHWVTPDDQDESHRPVCGSWQHCRGFTQGVT